MTLKNIQRRLDRLRPQDPPPPTVPTPWIDRRDYDTVAEFESAIDEAAARVGPGQLVVVIERPEVPV